MHTALLKYGFCKKLLLTKTIFYLHIGFSELPTALLCDISLGFYLEQCLSTVIYFLFYNLVLAYLGYG